VPKISKKQQAKMQRARKKALAKRRRFGTPPLTRGGLVTNPRTGQTYRLIPAPLDPRAVHATRQPGTIYDADRDGWVARGYEAPDRTSFIYDDDAEEHDPLWANEERSDDDYDPTGWHAQAVETSAREIAARPARITTATSPRSPACKRATKAVRQLRRIFDDGFKSDMICQYPMERIAALAEDQIAQGLCCCVPSMAQAAIKKYCKVYGPRY